MTCSVLFYDRDVECSGLFLSDCCVHVCLQAFSVTFDLYKVKCLYLALILWDKQVLTTSTLTTLEPDLDPVTPDNSTARLVFYAISIMIKSALS